MRMEITIQKQIKLVALENEKKMEKLRGPVLLKTKIQYRHSVFFRASGWWAATCYDQCSY